MLSMESALFRQSSSRARVTNANRELGCDPWSIHQPRPTCQIGALAYVWGVHIRVGGLLRHVAIFNIRNQQQDHEILNFCVRVYYEKLGHMLKALVLKFRPDLSARLKDVAEKQVPAKLKTIVVDVSIRSVLRYCFELLADITLQ